MTIGVSTIKEYSGVLLGGPEDGRLVSVSVTRIPTKETIELWLDGVGADKDINQIVTRGAYIWQEKHKHFKWEQHSTAWYTIRKLEED